MTPDPITRLNAALEGRYSIEREIGEGGMATVYLAHDVRHNRNVALKVLKAELAAVVGAERFLAEIETTAKLTHPHILPLFDSGEADGFLFFVTPYIEGDTLRDKIDREKQLSIEEALKITSDIAEALDHAHRHGVVHRDIKPANILLTDGRPLIADFGIALAVAQAGGGRVTETGLSVGTPHYMSPEQATGDRDVDPRTDVYALGCVLYEMLVGDPPYQGSTAQAVLAKILTDPTPAPTRVRLSIPPNVDAAIRKALEKLPADRFGSAQEFATALEDSGFRHGEEAAVAVAVSAGQWTPLAIATTASTLALALGLGWLLLRPDPPQGVTRQVLSTEGCDCVEAEFGRYSALAPDGSSMILPVGDQLALKMRGSTEIIPIPGTEQGRDVVYSPDGQWIAYAVGSNLFKRPLTGGSPVRLAEDVEPDLQRVALAWLDDGTILYESSNPQRVMQISEDGGDPRVVLARGALWAHGLPSGAGALVVSIDGLHTVDLRDLSSEVILDQVLRAWYAPTGHLVYVRTDGVLFAAPFDVGGLEIAGSEIPLFGGVRVAGNRADMRLAADGTVLYVEGSAPGSSRGQQLVVVDLEGNEDTLDLATRPIPPLGVGWSPDGESVAFSSEGQIYTYNVTLGTTPRQLTFEGNNTSAVFSPDGTRVAFSSSRNGTDGADLFVKDLNEDSPPRSIITLEANQFVMQWPSDTLIVFESGQSIIADLWMVSLSDPDNPRAEPYLSSEASLRRISVSPDGTLAAYRSNESGAQQIYIRSFPVPGERTLVSQGGGTSPNWAPDGNTLYYAVGPGRRWMAARLQADPVPVVLSTDSLFNSGGSGSEPFPSSTLHPDGDRFILARNVNAALGSDGDDSQPERLILVQNFFEELRQVVPD